MFTKEHTLQIKGAAILCMVGLHLFGAPERLPIESPAWFGTPLTKALQICVPIYLFMSGYGLQYGANQSPMGLRQLLSRLKKLYVIYWRVFVPFVGFGLFIGYYKFNLNDFLLTAIGMKWTYNGEWWFFSLYVELLVLFLLIGRINVKWWHYLTIMLLVLVATRVLNGKFDFCGQTLVARHFNLIMIDLNIFMMGCFFSRYDVFGWCEKQVLGLNKYAMLFIGMFVVILPVLIRAYCPLIGITELVFVPMFCYGIVVLSTNIPWGGYILRFLGKHSTNLWLTHSFFIFYYLNRMTMWTNNPFVLFSMVLGCSLICSIIIEYLKALLSAKLELKAICI